MAFMVTIFNSSALLERCAMSETTKDRLFAALLLAVGTALLSFGIWAGHADDAPGAGLLGIIAFLMFAFFAWRTLRVNRKR